MTEPWTTREVSAGELTVRYLDAGNGRPLPLLHGGLATASESLATPYRLLADTYRLLSPDTRAHGGTSHPGGPLTYPRLADDIAAFIAALGLQRPGVVGHSDGAQTALEFGRRHPGLAAGPVLSGTMSEPTADYLTGIREWASRLRVRSTCSCSRRSSARTWPRRAPPTSTWAPTPAGRHSSPTSRPCGTHRARVLRVRPRPDLRPHPRRPPGTATNWPT